MIGERARFAAAATLAPKRCSGVVGWRRATDQSAVHPVRSTHPFRPWLLWRARHHAASRCAGAARHPLRRRLHQLPDLRARARLAGHRPLCARDRLLGQRHPLRRQRAELGPSPARRRVHRRLDRQAALSQQRRRQRLQQRDRAAARGGRDRRPAELRARRPAAPQRPPRRAGRRPRRLHLSGLRRTQRRQRRRVAARPCRRDRAVGAVPVLRVSPSALHRAAAVVPALPRRRHPAAAAMAATAVAAPPRHRPLPPLLPRG